jgi:FkbH-like protein
MTMEPQRHRGTENSQALAIAGEWERLVQAIRTAGAADTIAVHARSAREIGRLIEAGRLPEHVSPLRIAVLRSFTVEVFQPSLVAALAAYDLAASVQVGQLGNIAQESLSPDSFLYTGSFDVCLVMALAEHVLSDLGVAAGGGIQDRALAEFLDRLEQLAGRFRGLVIVCNFAQPPYWVTPQLQAQSPGGGRYAIEEANRRLAGLAGRYPNLRICDVARLAGQIGTERFWSPRDMFTSMQPLSAAALPRLAAEIADLVLLYRRTPVKCIVLDCDNTLWGGIIGEDGLGGIRLGETYPGLCYQEFQRQLRELTRAGFLLALNSKNNEADVRRVFAEHPGMVLRPEHIAAERVNWQDKVTNMHELAEELNIGLDSFVFIDDSDFEINLVRERLPQVRTLQVPPEPWKLPGLLPAARLIDRLAVTAEDQRKSQMYVQERQRKQFRSEADSLEAYLRGLEIRLAFEPFDPEQHTARAAQLTQKTNQFNLTTRRYTEADLRELSRSGAGIYLASLSDRFGDYGRIALAIVRPTDRPAVGRLDVFLMSCRVIGRGVEDSFLRLVMRDAQRRGLAGLEAEYIPTPRNVVCRDFLARFGFREVGRREDGTTHYEYDFAAGIPAVDDWISVR